MNDCWLIFCDSFCFLTCSSLVLSCRASASRLQLVGSYVVFWLLLFDVLVLASWYSRVVGLACGCRSRAVSCLRAFLILWFKFIMFHAQCYRSVTAPNVHTVNCRWSSPHCACFAVSLYAVFLSYFWCSSELPCVPFIICYILSLIMGKCQCSYFNRLRAMFLLTCGPFCLSLI